MVEAIENLKATIQRNLTKKNIGITIGVFSLGAVVDILVVVLYLLLIRSTVVAEFLGTTFDIDGPDLAVVYVEFFLYLIGASVMATFWACIFVSYWLCTRGQRHTTDLEQYTP